MYRFSNSQIALIVKGEQFGLLIFTHMVSFRLKSKLILKIHERKMNILKVSKFQKQIFLFSFEPKNKRSYFLISALASKKMA